MPLAPFLLVAQVRLVAQANAVEAAGTASSTINGAVTNEGAILAGDFIESESTGTLTITIPAALDLKAGSRSGST